MHGIKQGVRLIGVKPEMLAGDSVVTQVYVEHGHQAIVTSGTEGSHSRGSRHYVGCALDYRTRMLSPNEKGEIANTIQQRLGDLFDVVLEETHLHVEYDPER